MRHRLIWAVIFAAVFGTSAIAAGDPQFSGRWHWNKAESSSAPGEPLPRDVVLTITSATSARVQWTITRTDADGSQHLESFNGSGAGQPAPISGEPGSTGAFIITPTAMSASYINSDGSSERASCSLSPDGRKMTCRGIEYDGKGHSLNYTDVYDRF